MGLTLAEKIISEHAGKEVHAGELVIANVDVTAVCRSDLLIRQY